MLKRLIKITTFSEEYPEFNEYIKDGFINIGNLKKVLNEQFIKKSEHEFELYSINTKWKNKIKETLEKTSDIHLSRTSDSKIEKVPIASIYKENGKLVIEYHYDCADYELFGFLQILIIDMKNRLLENLEDFNDE